MASGTPLVTRKGDQVDNYHGEIVADPYRWLEDTNDPETKTWVGRQNEATEAFLAAVPARRAIRARMTEIWDYPKFGVPFERGGRWFQERNSGLQDQSVLYVLASPDDPGGEVLLDPNLLAEDGTVSVPAVAINDDGSLLAYATSAAGSDWMTWHVREISSRLDRADVVEWCKYGTAVWARDRPGFYYSATAKPRPSEEYTEQVGLVRIHFHVLGTSQNVDELVFEAPHEPEWIPEVTLTEDGRFVVISISVGTATEARVDVLDLFEPEPGFRPLVDDFSSLAHVVTNVGATFFLVTDDHAERHRLVAVELGRPGRQNWREILAQREAVLVGARNCGGRLVCHYLQDACSRLAVFELDGTPVRELPLTAVSSVDLDYDRAGVQGRERSDLVHFQSRSFVDPGTLWSHNVATGATKVLRRSTAPVDAEDFVSEEVFVTADDGASVPLFLTRRRDLVPDGRRPCSAVRLRGLQCPRHT